MSRMSDKTWTNFDSLRREKTRLQTFGVGWPLDWLAPKDLAKAGFFYLKRKDYVQCAFCRGVVGIWETNDVPLEEHKKCFPLCPFIEGLAVGNVTESDDPDDEPDCVDVDYKTFTGTDVRPFARCERSTRQDFKNPEAVGIMLHRGPKYPDYATLDSRLATYTTRWTMRQSPLEMAQAGFFYAGLSDHVRCFYCGGGLRNWKPQDDPRKEHEYWFSKCPHVRKRAM